LVSDMKMTNRDLSYCGHLLDHNASKFGRCREKYSTAQATERIRRWTFY